MGYKAKMRSFYIGLVLVGWLNFPASALPTDTPEEVLRNEIITEARSPIDGQVIDAGEYALQTSELQADNTVPDLAPSVVNLINLLRLRQFLRSILLLP
jgi:hypothetical protein